MSAQAYEKIIAGLEGALAIAKAGNSAGWHYVMDAAPLGAIVMQTRKGKDGPVEVPVFVHAKVILCGNCGTVTASRWLPDEKRWEMFSKTETPLAWQPWPTAAQVAA